MSAAARHGHGEPAEVAGVVLAGGLARRMGGRGKAFIELAGRPLVAHVIDRLRPQVSTLLLNANEDAPRLKAFGLPVVTDPLPGHAGPLAGVLAALYWLREHAPWVRWLVSVAVDTPFFPRDLAARLIKGAREEGATLACAASAGRAHPVFGLWPLAIADDLAHALIAEDVRRIDRFTARYPLAQVDFSHPGRDPFFNINRPEDLARAGELLASRP